MDTKLGAFWKSKQSDRGPIAKGTIDFSRIPEDDKARIHDAFVKGEKLRITLWRNRHDDGDKKPDFNMTLDAPWDHGEHKPAPAGFSNDIPF